MSVRVMVRVGHRLICRARYRCPRAHGALILLLLAVAAGCSARGSAGPNRTPSGPKRQGDAGPAAVRLRQPDGGARYFASWPRSFPVDPDFFPVGVWFESVTSPADVALDQDAGLNTYVALTANSDLPLIAARGMRVLAQWEEWGNRADAPGSEAIAGWLLYDEVDMVEGPKRGPATLIDIVKKLPAQDGRIRYNNYGKGVLFWETDAEAARFVNEFQDVVSADSYWFTDNNICSQSEGGRLFNAPGSLGAATCHRAANYGATTERLRNLMQPAGIRPVWAYVETGHPSTQDNWPTIQPAEVRAAVWSSVIHGARGIVYFNHSFGGSAPTQHVLRDPTYAAVRTVVKDTNQRIKSLAPVLNAPFVDGLLSVDGQADAMAKSYRGKFYVFAGSRVNESQAVTIDLACVGDTTVTVIDENRSLAMRHGSFTDTFVDANAVHIYSLDPGSDCLPAG